MRFGNHFSCSVLTCDDFKHVQSKHVKWTRSEEVVAVGVFANATGWLCNSMQQTDVTSFPNGRSTSCTTEQLRWFQDVNRDCFVVLSHCAFVPDWSNCRDTLCRSLRCRQALAGITMSWFLPRHELKKVKSTVELPVPFGNHLTSQTRYRKQWWHCNGSSCVQDALKIKFKLNIKAWCPSNMVFGVSIPTCTPWYVV